MRYELDRLALRELFGVDVEADKEAHSWLMHEKLLEETLI